jgi:hypothetical protein
VLNRKMSLPSTLSSSSVLCVPQLLTGSPGGQDGRVLPHGGVLGDFQKPSEDCLLCEVYVTSEVFAQRHGGGPQLSSNLVRKFCSRSAVAILLRVIAHLHMRTGRMFRRWDESDSTFGRATVVPRTCTVRYPSVSRAVNIKGTIAAVVVGTCTLLLLIGISLTVVADEPTTGPNLQTVGLVIMLIALTTLVLVRTMRDPADPT